MRNSSTPRGRERPASSSAAGLDLLLGTSPVLAAFRRHQYATSCPYARRSPLVGGLEWNAAGGVADNCRRNLPLLEHFVGVSRARGVEGIVLALGPEHGRGLPALATAVNTYLRMMAAHDPGGTDCFAEPIDVPGWRFRFGGQQMFVSATASFYPPSHSRCAHAPDRAFLFLQPMHAFDLTGSVHSARNRAIKQRIRGLFDNAGTPYDRSLVEQPLEAVRYVKPLALGDPPVRWWQSA